MKKFGNRLLGIIIILMINVDASALIDCRQHWQSYINKKLGFSFCFPKNSQLRHIFKGSYYIPNTWSILDLSKAQSLGRHQVINVSLIDVHTDQQKPPPAASFLANFIRQHNIHPSSYYYFSAVVRVGVSATQNDINKCYRPTATVVSNADKLNTKLINGRMFHVFTRREVGMSQTMSANSYRYKNRHYCYSIEYIETGGGLFDALGNTAQVSKYYADVAQQIINSIHIVNA